MFSVFAICMQRLYSPPCTALSRSSTTIQQPGLHLDCQSRLADLALLSLASCRKILQRTWQKRGTCGTRVNTKRVHKQSSWSAPSMPLLRFACCCASNSYTACNCSSRWSSTQAKHNKLLAEFSAHDHKDPQKLLSALEALDQVC